jgi:hypothetical protein
LSAVGHASTSRIRHNRGSGRRSTSALTRPTVVVRVSRHRAALPHTGTPVCAPCPHSIGCERKRPCVTRQLLPLRYARMASSPWAYLRGAAAVMAADLAAAPHSGLTAQMCGDAHVLNFGLWASPERQLLFDVRDFDETLPGPFEWDLKRLATSIYVLADTERLPGSCATTLPQLRSTATDGRCVGTHGWASWTSGTTGSRPTCRWTV